MLSLQSIHDQRPRILLNHNQKIIHLLHRTTGGPRLKDLLRFQSQSIIAIVDELIHKSSTYKQFTRDQVFDKNLDTLKKARGVKYRNRVAKRRISDLYIMQLAKGEEQLREKISFFWHDHFPVNVKNPGQTLSYLNTIRKHALGSFRELLHAVSREKAMILYLDNNKNIEGQPNENFAREVMELFTLGIGHYTENDVLEAARAFTGWNNKNNGDFIHIQKHHDKGSKTILGQTGQFTGDDVLNILLDNKQTSRYITSKLYQFLTGQTIPNGIKDSLSDQFYNSDYDICLLLRLILNAEDFYAPSVVSQKIKSPIELITNLVRLLNLEFKNATYLYKIQMKLGQIVLYPPNVSGWTFGKSWIDLNTVTERLELGDKFLSNKTIRINKPLLSLEGDEDSGEDGRPKNGNQFNFSSIENFLHLDPEENMKQLAQLLFNRLSNHLDVLIAELTNRWLTGDISTKDLLIVLLSQPEYQLN